MKFKQIFFMSLILSLRGEETTDNLLNEKMID